AGAALEASAELFDAEDDPGERRVEGRRNAGRRADQDQPRLLARRHATDREHDRGSDLDGRTFAADRAAAEQPEKRQQNFPYSDADRDEPSPRALIGESARGDRLRNAATLRIAKKPVRQENREHEAQRCDDEGRIAPARHQEVEGVLRLVGQEGEHHGRRANRDTAEEEDRAALPAGPGDPKHPPTALGKQQFLETRMARGKGHSRSWDWTVRAGSAL